MNQIGFRKFSGFIVRFLLTIALIIQIFLLIGLWKENERIDVNSIEPNQGFAYIAALPNLTVSFPLNISSDGPGAPANSTLIVYENGRRLGPAHSAHDQIRQAGNGAYSHWNAQLYFSSSDGSDPRTNGRTYTAVVTVEPDPGALIINVLALILVCAPRYKNYISWGRIHREQIRAYGTIISYLIVALAFFLMRQHGGEEAASNDILIALLLVATNVVISSACEYLDVFSVRDKVPSTVRRITYLACGFLAVVAGALCFGLLPAVNVAATGFEIMMPGQAKPSGLASAIIMHALGSVALALMPFMVGVGAIGCTNFRKPLSLHGLILAGYPVGIGLMALGSASFLAIPYGWIVSIVILVIAVVGWRRLAPVLQLLKHYAVLVAALCPFGLLCALWFGLDWHGPFAGAGGLTSGDLSFYSNSIWSLQAHGLPMPNLGVEGERFPQAGVPNMLISMIGAAAAGAIALDPYLFMTSAATMIYVLGMGILLTAFLSDKRDARLTWGVAAYLIGSVVAAGRYPYWIAESPPVAHAIPLAVSIFWYSQRGTGTVRGFAATIGASLVGSAVSKVVALSFFACLSLSRLGGIRQNQFRVSKLVLILTGLAVVIYAAMMLKVYGHIFLSIGRFGPESYRYYWGVDGNFWNAWPFVARDAGVLLLWALCIWLLVLRLSVSVAFLSFIAYTYLFQINMAVAIISIALFFVVKPEVFRRAPVLWTIALTLTVPAMLFTDPSGVVAGPIWLTIAIGIAVCSMAFSASQGQTANYVSTICRMSAYAAGVVGLLVVAVEYKHLSVTTHPVSIPFDAMEIWAQVREKTDPDTLVFTDQTSPEGISIVGGWNSVSVSGTRQIYVSNWVQSSLRTNAEAKDRHYRNNEAVLSGQIRPDAVDFTRPYMGFAAVVRADRVMPAGWHRVGGNPAWALYIWKG